MLKIQSTNLTMFHCRQNVSCVGNNVWMQETVCKKTFFCLILFFYFILFMHIYWQENSQQV